jgi:flavin reductase (DIM6/NTAB) family NADH-FMN oxidoreductase RutF
MNKKNIGAALALYPSPVIVIGTMVDEKPTWTLAAHAGTMAHSHLMVSLNQAHYINKGIKESKKLSVNVVDASWLKEADKAGTVSGNKEDKSKMFNYSLSQEGVPMIDAAKVSIVCDVEDDYELEHFDNFVCRIVSTYCDENILNEKDKIDYHVFKPVLFEFPTYEYFVTGEKAGDCAKMIR